MSGHFVAAAHAGISAIPVNTTTKRAMVRWSAYQEHIAEMVTLIEWDRQQLDIALVTGAVSGRLLCIDIEGSFMEGHGLEELRRRLVGDTYKVFWNWINGYCESTPSGGIHILIRLEGEGPLEGNTKLASDPGGKTLIETRAEGGYVIVAPSRNGSKGWELMSGGFDSIAYATTQEWKAVAAVLMSFGETETPPYLSNGEPRTKGPSPLFLGDGPRWIADALAQLPNIRTVLSAHGWDTDFRHDKYGEHWTRPGKDPREGHSASISAADRVFVHSSNAGLPMGNPTLDALDVILCYELGRRPNKDERTEYLRQFRPHHPGGEVAERVAQAVAGPTDPSLYLPDDFWHARPWLEAVRTAAMRRMISPDAVLGALLSAYATTIPMGIRLPAIVGQWAPLNLYSVLVSRSGGGKTSAMGLADELLGPVSNPDILFRSLRSGEGLINLATRKTSKDEPPSYRVGVQIAFDEGGVLSRQTERSGSTTIPYLNTAWAGHGMVGGAKASEDGFFPASLVRICAVIGVQFGAAANLFMGESQILGFPQRLTFYGLDHPELLSISRRDSDYGPVRALGLPTWEHAEFTRSAYEMKVPDEVADEVWRWTQSKHGDAGPTALDGHMMNLRLRLAAVLALASGEGAIERADWDLATQVESTSRSLRQALLASLGDVGVNRAREAGRADATRQIAREDVFLERAALHLAKKVQRSDEPLSKRAVKDCLRSYRHRYNIVHHDVVTLAIQRGWVLSTGDGALVPGPVRIEHL